MSETIRIFVPVAEKPRQARKAQQKDRRFQKECAVDLAPEKVNPEIEQPVGESNRLAFDEFHPSKPQRIPDHQIIGQQESEEQGRKRQTKQPHISEAGFLGAEEEKTTRDQWAKQGRFRPQKHRQTQQGSRKKQMPGRTVPPESEENGSAGKEGCCRVLVYVQGIRDKARSEGREKKQQTLHSRRKLQLPAKKQRQIKEPDTEEEGLKIQKTGTADEIPECIVKTLLERILVIALSVVKVCKRKECREKPKFRVYFLPRIGAV